MTQLTLPLRRARTNALCPCGERLRHHGTSTRTGLCRECWNRVAREFMPKPDPTPAQAALVNWASDPCQRCGKWPLSHHNRTGYCRKCSRNHVARKLYPHKPH